MTEITELQVQYQAGVITGNFEEVRTCLLQKIEDYKNVVYTSDTVKDAKKDVADLRKLRKVLDDKRKEIKKTWNDPYKAFEEMTKELIAIIDEPIEQINSQIENFEQQRQAEKREKIKEEYSKRFNSELEEYCPLDNFFDDKWLNSSTTMKSINDALDAKKTFIEESIKVIKDCGEETEEKALKMFKDSLNLQEVLAWINQYRLQKEDILKKQREEEKERIRKAEEERIRREEQAKLEAEKREAEAKAQAQNEQMAMEKVQEKQTEPAGFVATSQEIHDIPPVEQGFSGFSTVSEPQPQGFGGFDTEPPAQSGFHSQGFGVQLEEQQMQGFGGFDTEPPAQSGFHSQGFGVQLEEQQMQGFGGFQQVQEKKNVLFTIQIPANKAEQFEELLKVWGYLNYQRRSV